MLSIFFLLVVFCFAGCAGATQNVGKDASVQVPAETGEQVAKTQAEKGTSS